jgi:hypothetical protein
VAPSNVEWLLREAMDERTLHAAADRAGRRRALTAAERDALQAARVRLLADMRRPPRLR